MGTTYGGYIQISDEMLSALTDEQEKQLYEMLAMQYAQQLEYQERRERFNLSAELNWNRTHAKTPAHLLCLKKPILPNKWLNFREGWSKENWGFSSKDLTPDEVKKPVGKMMNEIGCFKKVYGEIALGDGFKLPEVTP